jgi:hypothetical protein
MSAIGGKADIKRYPSACLLMTQSGHQPPAPNRGSPLIRPMLVAACTPINRHPSPLNSCLVEIARNGYCAAMSVLLSKIARYVSQKAASDPEAREKVVKGARVVFEEAKQIAKENDRAYAAGRAFRRAFDKWQGNQ